MELVYNINNAVLTPCQPRTVKASKTPIRKLGKLYHLYFTCYNNKTRVGSQKPHADNNF